MDPGPICIIGAGMAGGRAAAALRERGYDGELLLLGEESEPPYERPPLSKAYLSGQLDRGKLLLRDAGFYRQQSIEWRPGALVTGIDRERGRLRLGDGSELPYGRLLLSPGSRPRRLGVPGEELAGVAAYRDLADADRLRQELVSSPRVLVVGGGFLGSELAAVARAAGCPVTVVEQLPELMGGFPGEIQHLCHELHLGAGVELRLGCTVSQFRGGQRVEAALLDDGSQVPCDLVLVCVGAEPRTELAAAAGLELDGGIVVDRRLEAAPGLFAAGDVASWPSSRWGRRLRLEHYDNAHQQGLFAAGAMLGEGATYDPLPYFWTEQYQATVQQVGVPEPGQERVLRGDPASLRFSLFLLERGLLRACVAVNRFPDLAAARRLIEAGVAVDTERLGDPGLDLRAWSRQLTGAA